MLTMTAPLPSSALPSRTVLRGWQILIVEDDPTSLHLLEEILYQFGAKVHTAANGLEALRMLDYLQPDLLITDLSLPVMSGWELLERLRRDPRWRTLPAVALTAHTLPGLNDRAHTAGFIGYMTKPIQLGSFMSELLAIVAGSSATHPDQ